MHMHAQVDKWMNDLLKHIHIYNIDSDLTFHRHLRNSFQQY